MKTALLCLVFCITPCFAQTHKNAVKPKPTPELTFAQWIAEMNAKKQHCTEKDGSWLGGGSDGYNSDTEHCISGVIVYKDTSEESRKEEREREKHKFELVAAMTTRVLTESEMTEVLEQGSDILVQPFQAFNREEVDNKFIHMMLVQQLIRDQQKATLCTGGSSK